MNFKKSIRRVGDKVRSIQQNKRGLLTRFTIARNCGYVKWMRAKIRWLDVNSACWLCGERQFDFHRARDKLCGKRLAVFFASPSRSKTG
jgi:hypothetical protein